MKLKVEKEKTLLVDGPARIQLLSGKATVLGARVKAGEQVVVRRGKRMVLEALRGCKVELILGGSASYTQIDGSSIPPSWKEAVDEILSKETRKTVLVIGGVDSGKTSFCTYLTNSALNAKRKVALLDGDLGQSDIGPPGTVSLSFIKEPTFDFHNLRSENLYFIGVTSPSRKVMVIVDAFKALRDEALERGAGLLIINTDGWVEGDDAVSYKTRLEQAVGSDAVAAIQKEDELAPILDASSDVKTFVVGSPPNIKKRDWETRKLLRESAYIKYLKDSKVRSFPLSWVKIDGDLKLNGEKMFQMKARIESLLGKEVLHCEEASDSVIFILRKRDKLEEDALKRLESEFDKRTIGLHEGDEEGILVALGDTQGRILGFGTIDNINFKKRTIKICTPVDEAVSKIHVGCIKLDREGKENGLIFEPAKASLTDRDS
ncbi:MAG: Clp1/GlmU family protein [Candidatus Bathyarchaeota archaeon]|nr:Clp1/GlmU family protein [Candidatus Bathyarchaeota archaeon]